MSKLDIEWNTPGCGGILMFGTIALSFLLAGMKGCIDDKMNKRELTKERRIHMENIIGEQTPDKFYLINGQRVFLEIDGQPVEQYLANKKKYN